MAKKWQDVEFVDYKERQKRRRMRKRMDAQEEISDSFRGRWNAALIGLFIVFFILLMGISAYYLLAEEENLELKEANMFLKVGQVTGTASYRDYLNSESVLLRPNQQIFKRGQFRTDQGSTLELMTIDKVSIKIRESSEIFWKSIEVFDSNQNTKSTFSIDSGELVLDSRSSGGWLEIQIESISIYALSSLFKVSFDGEKISIKVSAGKLSVERFDEKRVVAASQMVSGDLSNIGQVLNFNPLTEIW